MTATSVMSSSATTLLLLLLPLSLLFLLAAPIDVVGSTTVSITRHHRGDVFDVSDTRCSMETCVGVSSGTASLTDGNGVPVMGMDDPTAMTRSTRRDHRQATVSSDGGTTTTVPNLTAAAGTGLSSNGGGCRCQCIQPMPVFRDDLQICVDDLQECSLASFVSGTTVQKIPYVFLPLQGQIAYPSAEIKITGMQYPTCAVSKAKYLTRAGWVNFKNQSDLRTPFQIHRENGHIMLLWLGDLQSRANIEGRLVLIEMICKETLAQDYDNSLQQATTPCISFRIAGTPSVKEVLFSADVRTTDNAPGTGLTISELIAVAICSVLLGLMYVASILLYLHVRKGRPKGRATGDIEAYKNPLMSNGMVVGEDGLVKNNPLLQHGYNDNEAYESDDDDGNYGTNVVQGEPSSMDVSMENNNSVTRNLTTAIVHPIQSSFNSCAGGHPIYYSEPNSIEKHPEEDVSIVETLDHKEDRPNNIRSIMFCSPRKKLYFNPDYFELELLMAPPPAALEFLEKIREVIHEARRKISTKKFAPNLCVIPEDVDEPADEPPSSSCNKCRTQLKIKSATIEKWLMDVPPTEVTEPKKNPTTRDPVTTLQAENDGESPPLEETDASTEEEGDDEECTNIECDSLERSTNYRRKCGYHTPSEYSVTRPDSSPIPSGCAMEEELTVRTAYTYDTITKRESRYEHISGPDRGRDRARTELPLADILCRSAERYSLVSEVYVNDNFAAKQIDTKSPGRITIEVEDCPGNHPAEDSDSFEPDTLDRHCAKPKRKLPERSGSNGFGSLLEIYEAKSVMADVQKRWNQTAAAGKYLTPDPKHCRRQRCPSSSSAPKPPKNARVRSTSSEQLHVVVRTDRVRSPYARHDITAGASDKPTAKCSPNDHNRYEDSGYLSTESNESSSFGKAAATSLDTDESGAESIDTDFKYFKTRADRRYRDW